MSQLLAIIVGGAFVGALGVVLVARLHVGVINSQLIGCASTMAGIVIGNLVWLTLCR